MVATHFIDLERIFEGLTHIAWAERIAVSIARNHGFRADTDETAEILSESRLILVVCRAKFRPDRVPPGGNPDGLFRGWSHMALRRDLAVAARRLRTGGVWRAPHNFRVTVLSTVEDETSILRIVGRQALPVETVDYRHGRRLLESK